jgi:hypothetical protein
MSTQGSRLVDDAIKRVVKLAKAQNALQLPRYSRGREGRGVRLGELVKTRLLKRSLTELAESVMMKP